MTRVARVGRWNEGPLAPAFYEGPVVDGLLPVVVAAEPVEQVVGGDLGLGPVLAVVVLQSGGRRAAFDRARRVQEVQGGTLVGVGVSSVVVDAGQRAALGEQADDERI